MNAARFLETTSRDLLYALRTMRRSYGFALVAVIVLALGIGANSACFTVIRAVLLRPLAYRQPDQLVSFSMGATPTRFEELRRGAHSFSGIGTFTGEEDVTLTGGAEPQVLKAVRVSAPFLQILGAAPLLGRSFLTEEDTPGGAPTAMISADLWRTHFGGDLRIVGKTIGLTGTPYTIVGVLPAAFHFPSPGLDVWLTRPQESPAFDARSRVLSPFLSLFARLRPGVTLAQANAEAAVLQRQYARNHPAMLDAKPKSPVLVNPLKEEVVGKVRSELWMLFGAVGLVLLIACANLASLLLARAHARSHEFAVRAALGAGRGQLMRQLLTESILLSAMGGTLGVLLALVGLQGLRSMTAWSLPRMDEIHLDGTVLAFAAVLSCATGILTGLMPAFAASRSDLIAVLRSRTAGAGQWSSERLAVRFSVRGVLVMGQIALSMILLTGAALLIESVIQLGNEDLGFDSSHLFTARLSLPLQRYDNDRKKGEFYRELLQGLETAPGVQSATAAMTLPMTIYAGSPVQDADRPVLPLNERLIAKIFIVSQSYFRTLRIPVRRGRTFTERDREGTQRVTVIDEALARRFWPSYPAGENPVGHHLLIGGTNPHPVEIIGIVANVHQTVDNAAWPEGMYVDLAQAPLPSAMIAVRTQQRDPLQIAAVVRERIGQIDRDQAISDVRSMQELVDEQLGERRVLMTLLGSFAGVATLLAALGTYGVIAYSVTQRTQELGIRRALGAGEADVVWLVVQQALGLALIGTVAGVAGAAASTRLLKSFLFHVSATDPLTMAGVSVLFLVITMAASYLPVRRALGVDPMVALRYE